MTNTETLFDPTRTIPAGKIEEIRHITLWSAERKGFITACGVDIGKKELMVILQRPKDINCRKCRKFLF